MPMGNPLAYRNEPPEVALQRALAQALQSSASGRSPVPGGQSPAPPNPAGEMGLGRQFADPASQVPFPGQGGGNGFGPGTGVFPGNSAFGMGRGFGGMPPMARGRQATSPPLSTQGVNTPNPNNRGQGPMQMVPKNRPLSARGNSGEVPTS